MKKEKKAFSLIIAMGLVFVTVLLGIIIIEYIIPFNRDIRGIENATISYYLSYSGLENGIYFFSRREPEDIMKEIGPKYSFDIPYSTGSLSTYGYSFQTYSSGSLLPAKGTGTSEFNSDFNSIAMGDSIQLSIGYGFLKNPSNLKVRFKIPEMKTGLSTTLLQKGPIINWQLSSENQTLNALTTSMFDIEGINGTWISMSSKEGRTIDGNEITILDFYDSNCKGDSNKCILRFSVINPLTAKYGNSENITLPFLEWQINVKPSLIPLRYSRIKSVGRAYGYSRTLEIRYPQDTVSEALDFTVFQ